MFKQILSALDTSENSINALDYAADLASRENASLHIISVIESITGYPVGIAFAYNEAHIKEMRKKYENLQAEQFERIKLAYPELEVTTEISVGHPATEIVESAQDVDLIILGNRGQSRIASWVLGSVAKEIVDSCTVSVLVVKSLC